MAATVGIPRRWTVADSAEMYAVRAWGGGYFCINDAGNVSVTPTAPTAPPIDLKELVDEVRRRGIGLPLLIRFSDILKSRIVELNEAFRRAIAEYGYKGAYRASTRSRSTSTATWSRRSSQFGRPYHYGLEAGSKPELLAVMAHARRRRGAHRLQRLQGRGVHRDGAASRSKLGRTVIIVVEKLSELPLIAEIAEAASACAPRIGIRVKLSSAARGAGRPRAATARSSACRRASWSRRSTSCARTTCSTASSCCTSTSAARSRAIRAVKNALREAGRFYVELCKLGAPLKYLDVGRRPGRRLRRLADQLRVVDELHDAGVRQRHRVRAAGALRRGRRAAPDASSPSRAARSSPTTRCW